MFYWVIFTLALIIANLLFRIRVSGKENLDACEGGRFIICPNHIHFLDPVTIAIQRFARRRLVIMAKIELFKNPFAGWFLGKLNVVPIERGKGDSGVIDIITKKMNDGNPLLLFPEGTRSKDGNLQPLKSGALFIAAATNATIIPCHVSIGGKKKLRPLGKIYIKFGKPLTPEILAMNPEDKRTFRAAKQMLRQSIEELADEC